jgi:hypothetical protein
MRNFVDTPLWSVKFRKWNGHLNKKIEEGERKATLRNIEYVKNIIAQSSCSEYILFK